MDSAFFSDEIIRMRQEQGIEFTVSVPFEKIETLRQTLIQRAGRLTRPQGKLTLTFSAKAWIQKRILKIFNAIPA